MMQGKYNDTFKSIEYYMEQLTAYLAQYEKRADALVTHDTVRNRELAQAALDNLTHYVNRVLDMKDQYLTETLNENQAINHDNPVTALQNQERLNRRLREGVMVPLGSDHQNQVRGFQSVAEGKRFLNTIMGAFHGIGIHGVKVAIRGSAVRGSNRDRTRPYREATEDKAQVSNASDVDFFFTCPALEKALDRYRGGSVYEQGGNVKPQNLIAILRNSELSLKNDANQSVNQPALANDLEQFGQQARGVLGRNADVTLVKQSVIQTFSADEYILV